MTRVFLCQIISRERIGEEVLGMFKGASSSCCSLRRLSPLTVVLADGPLCRRRLCPALPLSTPAAFGRKCLAQDAAHRGAMTP